MEVATPPTHWTLDKKVPVALIITVIAQFGATIWYASKLDGRVATLEAVTTTQTIANARQDDAIHAIDTRLARIEERQTSSLEILKNLERLIYRRIEAPQ